MASENSEEPASRFRSKTGGKYIEKYGRSRRQQIKDGNVVLVKKPHQALAGVAELAECHPINGNAAGSISSQGICLSHGFGPQ